MYGSSETQEIKFSKWHKFCFAFGFSVIVSPQHQYVPLMADVFLHQSLSQQQTLAPQMRKSLEILQAGTLELSQLVQQALETNPVLEDLTESISLDEESPDAEEADSLDYMNQTDDDWRDRTILEGKSSPWTSEDEERRQRIYDSIVAPETLQQHLQHQLDPAMVDPEIREAAQPISETWMTGAFAIACQNPRSPHGPQGQRTSISR